MNGPLLTVYLWGQYLCFQELQMSVNQNHHFNSLAAKTAAMLCNATINCTAFFSMGPYYRAL